MPGFAKKTNRLTSFFIYVVFIIIAAGAGIKAVRYSKDLNFYYNYLLKWETALTILSSKDLALPRFTGINRMEYMDNLVKLMGKLSIKVPRSNTRHAYIYQMFDKEFSKHRDVFLMCFEKKIILYGLSKTTFNMLDKNIDGKLGRNKGKFRGKFQKDKDCYAGIWEL
ncbi:MAG: hypothetical protein GXP56_17240 [Deltaproteobacteria bacterium]|nr:hypothetical protein [Deltaproteobacteria bacterium]